MMDKDLRQLSIQTGQSLLSRGATLTTAESCTGGWIAKVITDISGSSAWFEQGFVTYSNQAKITMLGVDPATLEAHGAVSEATVREMASGALQAAEADYAISVSGIAGPDGGSAEKPVGTVWFGFAAADGKVLVSGQQFTGDRDAIRAQAVAFALRTLNCEFLEK
ncbi:nicotinamide-nucleotide amidase [Tatumella sp. JGM100]|nr:nicotinamide-nucleotide amidase [Tatumella sp. JGM82]MBS0890091.1 nicotinamide-nucleotide amidase [Tatumella sp. JGM94]MBS0901926.1 nicotinamide-nucleotide amidase [Tatumella sp. JGM100]